jgi:hypothetical protein
MEWLVVFGFLWPELVSQIFGGCNLNLKRVRATPDGARCARGEDTI